MCFEVKVSIVSESEDSRMMDEPSAEKILSPRTPPSKNIGEHRRMLVGWNQLQEIRKSHLLICRRSLEMIVWFPGKKKFLNVKTYTFAFT